MNVILFEPHEAASRLAIDDRRARHILEVLRLRPGDSFDAGLVNGPRGKATIAAVDSGSLHLRFAWGEEPPALAPVTLVIGLPRPQTARKILEEATALGVQAIRFVATERGDPGYGQSRLWSSGEWRRHVIAGAEQAFSTRLPAVTWGEELRRSLEALDDGGARLALDNYESPEPLGGLAVAAPVTLAIGAERGWSPAERQLLRQSGFQFVHLGERVLRVETATVASTTLVLASLGYL